MTKPKDMPDYVWTHLSTMAEFISQSDDPEMRLKWALKAIDSAWYQGRSHMRLQWLNWTRTSLEAMDGQL